MLRNMKTDEGLMKACRCKFKSRGGVLCEFQRSTTVVADPFSAPLSKVWTCSALHLLPSAVASHLVNDFETLDLFVISGDVACCCKPLVFDTKDVRRVFRVRRILRSQEQQSACGTFRSSTVIPGLG